jgi:Trk K+ transport system NAD-binding subunit
MTDPEVTQDQPRWFVVCGDDSLAYRLAEELRMRHNGQVTVILRSCHEGYGPRIAKLDGVALVEAEQPDAESFAAARLDQADALALVSRDDVSNVDLALLAHEINPRVRVVVRMFNTSLGAGVAQLPYLTVLSDSEMAAPAFVAAALDRTSPRPALRDPSMHVIHRPDVGSAEVLCGLARTREGEEPELLPADQGSADLVLVRARRPPVTRAARRGRLRHHYPVRAMLMRIWRRLRIVFGAFVAVLTVGAVVLHHARPELGWWKTAYSCLLIAFGGIDSDLQSSTLTQVTETVLAGVSLAMVPLITAAVVDAVVKLRLELAERSLTNRARGHVVVAGLGGVGSHVVRQLYDLGVDVVAIDRDVDSRGVQVVRDLRIPFIAGDASRRDTLLAASVPTCRAVMALTADDATNLETALVGRTLLPNVPVVLRLFDADFAERIQRAFDINTSRSVSYLAAPSFAAQMLGQVSDAIAIGRHVLLVAQLTVEPYAELEGRTVASLRRPHESWIVEVINRDGQRLVSTAAGNRRLQGSDRLLVVATRRGLARLIAESGAPADLTVRGPIILHDSSPFAPPVPRHP